jgi:hypothetical protein
MNLVEIMKDEFHMADEDVTVVEYQFSGVNDLSNYRGPFRSIIQASLSEHMHHEWPNASHSCELLYQEVRNHQHQRAQGGGAQHFPPSVKVAV